MTNDEYREDPLEALLDAESDEEFGAPEIKDRFHHHADADVDGNLKSWSAEDFASIYTRFRPHLVRHARRYLSNPVQAEEVVQDAFLYLMTTLPELDSELGVLKFLKWKVRLLSLDVLRAGGKNRETPVGENIELASEDPEFSEEIERAEDAAIVRMALAKLNPRHREALIASIYEEKPTEVVASQLGLSENATRQLLFRARSAFKKALIGEVDTQGMSIGQVLSVATKKAAQDAGKAGAVIGGFLVLAAISIGILPNLNQPATVIATPEVVSEQPGNSSAVAESNLAEAPAATEAETTAPAESSSAAATESASPAQSTSPVVEEAPAATETEASDPVSEQPTEPVNEPVSQPATEPVSEPVRQPVSQPAPVSAEPALATLSTASFEGILETDVTNAGYYTESRVAKFSELFNGFSIEVFGGTGISAFMDVDPESRTAKNVIFQMWIDGKRYYAVARNTSSSTAPTASGYTITHQSSDFYVADDDGRVFDDSPLSDADARVIVKLDSQGTPVSASMKIFD